MDRGEGVLSAPLGSANADGVESAGCPYTGKPGEMRIFFQSGNFKMLDLDQKVEEFSVSRGKL